MARVSLPRAAVFASVATLSAAFLVPGFTPGSSDLDARFEGSDWGVGFSVGVNAQPCERLTLGAFFHSKVAHDLDGAAEFDLASSPAAQILNGAAGLFDADRFATALSTPASAGLGVRLAASERWTILASIKVTRWSEFEGVTLSFNDGATPAETVTQDWKDAWSASVGAEYAIGARTDVRAGVMVDQSPVNADFATPRIPDGDRHWFAAGVTQEFSEHLSADLGLAYAFFSDRRIRNGGALPEDALRGALSADFSTEAYAVSVRLRYKL